MGEISSKQKQILEYIRKYISQNSKSPTLQEISETCEMESRAAVHYHIQKLIDGGYISRGKNTREISLKETMSFCSIPIYGTANAGLPLSPAQEDYDLGNLQLDSRIVQNKGNLFAVKISGDSMNRQHVQKEMLKDGNYAIVDTKAHYRDGDVVLAVIDNAATIKVLKNTNSYVTLMPNSTNPAHHPIYILDNENFYINGKVILALESPNLN